MRTLLISSPAGNVEAELVVVDSWYGNTFYPDICILRILSHGVLLAVSDALRQSDGAICHSLELCDVTEPRLVSMRLGDAVQRDLRLRRRGCESDSETLDLSLRVSDISVYFTLSGRGFEQRIGQKFLSFLQPCRFFSKPGEDPVVAFVGTGLTAACWYSERALHFVLFRRLGELPENRFKVPGCAVPLEIADAAQASCILYTKLPFTPDLSVEPHYGSAVRSSFKLAFSMILEHFKYADDADDFVVLRGNPGEFAVIARRCGESWTVAGIAGHALTLTFRFEELWWRLPTNLRALRWSASLRRDPVLNESAELVDETFNGLAPDVRIAFEIKANGGFLINFKPDNDYCYSGGC
jgi:hypothetical protein